MIQSTKSFSQHLNGSSVAAPPTSEMQEEVDNDVEMNGAAQNGSHSGGSGETPVDPSTKEDSFLEMGIFQF